jgi:hypothetical protein
MKLAYALTPFVAWAVTGTIKFMVNSLRYKKLAFISIGYGGMPSNHSAVVSSIAALIAIKDGIDTPAFGVAITFAFIVILDAISLRKQIERHAIEINKLMCFSEPQVILRERIGHSPLEVLAGIITGVMVAGFINIVL